MNEFMIIYRTAIYSYVIDGEISYKAGMVATFTGKDREVTVCSPDRMPIGFFVTSSYDDYPFPGSPNTSVVIGQGEYQTETFEKEIYKINDLLYCSPNGIVTNKKTLENQATVGIVNHLSSDKIGFISCFTNLEYCKFKNE